MLHSIDAIIESLIGKKYNKQIAMAFTLLIMLILAFIDYRVRGNYLDVTIEFLFFLPVLLAGLISLSFGVVIASITTFVLFITNPLLSHALDAQLSINFKHILAVLFAWISYSLLVVIINELKISRIKAIELKKLTNRMFCETITSLCKAIDARDHYTAEHSKKVAEYARAIAEILKLSPAKQEAIYLAGLLHDIGKIGIAETYLNKRGKLTAEEWDTIQKHPLLGYEIVKNIPNLRDIALMVLYHHECFDGAGYPHRISGKEIPLGARILCVADSFDAMTSERIYRQAKSKEEAIIELRANVGKQFDSEVVNAFCFLLEKDVVDFRERTIILDMILENSFR